MKLLPTAFCAALLSVAGLVDAPNAQAQVNVNVNAGPPAWGPAVPAGTQFYYIPEIDGYYDLYAQQYIVFRDGQWIPVQVISGYDPYSFHPVVLDYRGRQPWMYVRDHRARYPRQVIVVPQRRGLPPGQARKLYREGYQQGRHDDRRDNRGNGNNGHGRRH
jgi:hypothetical protein